MKVDTRIYTDKQVDSPTCILKIHAVSIYLHDIS
jgi:hypothetical protein